MRLSSTLVGLALLLGAGVSPGAPELTESFRKSPPVVPAPGRIELPKVQELVLDNKVQIVLVERHDLPLVSLHVFAKRGTADAPPGVAKLATDMLFAGTASMTKSYLGRLLAGTAAGSRSSRHTVGVVARGMAADLNEALPALCRVFYSPLVPDEDFARAQSRRATSAEEAQRDMDVVVDRLVHQALFPARHAYGLSRQEEQEGLRGATRKDITAFFDKQVRTDQMVVVVAGDMTMGTLKQMVRSGFVSMKGKAAPAKSITPPGSPPPGAAGLVLADRRSKWQAEVRVAALAGAADGPDFPTLAFLNHVLGRGMMGRLFTNLRQQQGYSYEAGSWLTVHRGGSALVVGTAVAPETVADTLEQIQKELSRLRDEPLDPGELTRQKDSYARSILRRFESTPGAVDALSELVENGLPLDTYASWLKRVDGLTAADVQAAARKYLAPELLRTVVVGNASMLRAPLEKLGPVSVVSGD
jgi:zinc protease